MGKKKPKTKTVPLGTSVVEMTKAGAGSHGAYKPNKKKRAAEKQALRKGDWDG